jgi:hypothetical protein
MAGLCGNNSHSQHLCHSQAVDEIAFNMGVDTWYAVVPADDGEEKAIALRVAEDLRWTKIGIIVSSQFFKAQLK